MLVEVRIENCFSFNEAVSISFSADMRIKHLSANITQIGNFHVVKCAGIFGQNNAGKTQLLRCIAAIKDILLNQKTDLQKNIFIDNSLCRLGITFLEGAQEFSYDFCYDDKVKNFPFERFAEVVCDTHGNRREKEWLLRDTEKHKSRCTDSGLLPILSAVSQDNLAIYQINSEHFPYLKRMKKILRTFANKIDVVDMNHISLENTIHLLKSDSALKEKAVTLIKNADLYLDDFYLGHDEFLPMDIDLNDGHVQEQMKSKSIRPTNKSIDPLKLVSVYKGKPVPSILYDSVGTKKIVALAGYIVEALQNGRVLIVDELDSSLHFMLTRAIAALFNNELNQKAQLIFSAHDTNLIDIEKLFRKEQLWFVQKDVERSYVYSLADYTASRAGVRTTTDIRKKYAQGLLGAIPNPNLWQILIDADAWDGVND